MKRLLAVLLCLSVIMSFSYTCYATQTEDELNRLYNQHQYKEVIKQATVLLQQEPNNIRYNLIMGMTLADQEQFIDAIPYLSKAALNPNARNSKGWALFYLGKCYCALGKYTESQAKLLEARNLNTDQNLVEQATYHLKIYGFDEFYKDWRTVESEHFIFHLQSSLQIPDIKLFISEREADFAEVNNYFPIKTPKKIDTYIYASLEDYRKMAAPSFRPNSGGTTKAEFCLTHQVADMATIKHEMTHIITHYYQKTHKQIKTTRFINEGIAVYLSEPNCCSLGAINLVLNQNCSVLDLWNHWNINIPDDGFAYCISGAFVDYLIKEKGFDKFQCLMGDQTYENAKVVYGEEIDRMISNFDKQVNDYISTHKIILTEIKILGAYWQGDLSVKGLKPRDVKNHCFFLEIELPNEVSSSSIGEFKSKAGDQFELCAESKPVINAKIYEGGFYQDGFQKCSGFWLSINDEDFKKIVSGIPYKLVPKQRSDECKWKIGENVNIISR